MDPIIIWELFISAGVPANKLNWEIAEMNNDETYKIWLFGENYTPYALFTDSAI